jgi:hypothetical protein
MYHQITYSDVDIVSSVEHANSQETNKGKTELISQIILNFLSVSKVPRLEHILNSQEHAALLPLAAVPTFYSKPKYGAKNESSYRSP